MDDGFENLEDIDPPREFQLEIQLDISIIPDHTGLMGNNGPSGASLTTGTSQATAIGNAPPQDEVPSQETSPLHTVVQSGQETITSSSLTNSTDKPGSPSGSTLILLPVIQ